MLGRDLPHRVVGTVSIRSPFTAFRGERLAGIGHNQGPPLDGGQSWRAFAWRKARRELLPKLPLEILRRRVARAKQLGLDYPQYASILLGTGRDIVGFLFTCQALGMRLERTLPLPDPVVVKLRQVERCERLLMAEEDTDRTALALALAAETRITFQPPADAPNRLASWAEGRDAIHAALLPLRLPADAVVMIGTAAHERTWAEAARLAKFIPSEHYFPNSSMR